MRATAAPTATTAAQTGQGLVLPHQLPRKAQSLPLTDVGVVGNAIGRVIAVRSALTFGSLATTETTIRLSLHVLAATVFVGGQLTVAGLLSTVRTLGEGATAAVARAFARLAWPAYAVLLVTGFWNVSVVFEHNRGTAWRVVLVVKIVVVLVAGAAAYLHQTARSKTGLAIFGGLSGVTSLAAVVLGVLLAG